VDQPSSVLAKAVEETAATPRVTAASQVIAFIMLYSVSKGPIIQKNLV
jgi:hypothetical protein